MRRFRLPRKVTATVLASAAAAGFMIAATTAPASATEEVNIVNCTADNHWLFGKGQYATFKLLDPGTEVPAPAYFCYRNAGDEWFGQNAGDHDTGMYHEDATGLMTFSPGNNAGYVITADTDHPQWSDYKIWHFDKWQEPINLTGLYVYGLHIN